MANNWSRYNEESQRQLQTQLDALQFQDQKQEQDQEQDQKQDQDQDQKQDQDQWQSSYNDNKNENENESKNDNENESKNDNENDNENKNDNENDNKNENYNFNENKVDVDVDIDLDLEGELLPAAFDLDEKFAEDNDGIVFLNNDHVNQNASGGDGSTGGRAGDGGITFNVDQINNMVDNDDLHNPSVSFGGGFGGGPFPGPIGMESVVPTVPLGIDVGDVFVQYADVTGSTGDVTGSTVNEYGAGSLTNATSADTVLTQEAFTQNIVMGANIQSNSMTSVVGGSTIGDDLDDVA